MRNNLLLALAATLLTLLVLELGYRGYQYFALGVPFVGSHAHEADGATASVRGHPLFHYVPNPDLTDVDQHYFRVTGSPREATMRIAAVGGSTTYDTGVSAEDSYPFLLRERLQRQGIPARVLNAGAGSYQLSHVTARYVHQLRQMLRPGDWLLIDVGFNDALLHAGLAGTDRGHADYLKVVHGEDSLWRSIRILNWARARLDGLSCSFGMGGWFQGNLNTTAFRGQCGPVGRLAPDPAAVARYTDNLSFLIRMARADGLRPVLILQDYDRSRMHPLFPPLLEPVRRQLDEAARGAGAPVLDMRRFTRSRPELFVDGIHMNRRGNEIRAAALAALIQR